MAKLKEIQGVLASNVKRLRLEFAPPDMRTMNKFARWCGIGNSALEALEGKDGVYGNPQLSTICRIAQRLGMEPWQLLTKDATPPDEARQREINELRARLDELEGRKKDGIFDRYQPGPIVQMTPRRVAHKQRKHRK